jgi:beta-lactamase class A
LRELQPSTGTVSYVIREGGTERAALEATAPLAIGSAFKLAVLAALRDEIAHGRRHWNDVVPLEARWKTLPSGVIRTWPDKTPITLATYAAEMISISDNTAADALVRIAGPSALAAYAGRNSPFLTTREMFVLKSAPGAAQRAAYLAASTPAARASVLHAVDAMPLPPIDQLVPTPILAIEWHYSVRELCDLIGRVADLPLMSINPGLADAASFRRVAYKGGSDIGIINMTTQVTTKRGTRICFSATLNDQAKAVNENTFFTAYSSVLGALANN